MNDTGRTGPTSEGLSAVQAMTDDEIDMSDPDAPETLDWSGSERGKFYKLARRLSRAEIRRRADSPNDPLDDLDPADREAVEALRRQRQAETADLVPRPRR